jgi:hypothetical protein
VSFNIKHETALLESLDWDDEKLAELFEYLDSAMNAKVIKHPNNIINEVETMFSNDTAEIIKKIFLEISLINNLHIANKDNYDN